MSDRFDADLAALPDACRRCRLHLEEWIDARSARGMRLAGRGAADTADTAVLEQVSRHIESCEACAEEARWAQEVRRALAELPPMRCPDELAARLVAIPRQHEGAEAVSRRFRGPFGELAAAAALLALVAGAIWLALGAPVPSRHAPAGERPVAERPTTEPAAAVRAAAATAAGSGEGPAETLDEITPADLERAEREARVALALLGAVSQRAGFVLRDDVLRDQVAMAPRRALSRLVSD